MLDEILAPKNLTLFWLLIQARSRCVPGAFHLAVASEHRNQSPENNRGHGQEEDLRTRESPGIDRILASEFDEKSNFLASHGPPAHGTIDPHQGLQAWPTIVQAWQGSMSKASFLLQSLVTIASLLDAYLWDTQVRNRLAA